MKFVTCKNCNSKFDVSHLAFEIDNNTKFKCTVCSFTWANKEDKIEENKIEINELMEKIEISENDQEISAVKSPLFKKVLSQEELTQKLPLKEIFKETLQQDKKIENIIQNPIECFKIKKKSLIGKIFKIFFTILIIFNIFFWIIYLNFDNIVICSANYAKKIMKKTK